jgi:hypothetical protein
MRYKVKDLMVEMAGPDVKIEKDCKKTKFTGITCSCKKAVALSIYQNLERGLEQALKHVRERKKVRFA